MPDALLTNDARPPVRELQRMLANNRLTYPSTCTAPSAT
jgi:hypothetical protein